jgi:hypothetical protein
MPLTTGGLPAAGRPSNAAEILAGNLDTVINLLKERGIKEEEIATCLQQSGRIFG